MKLKIVIADDERPARQFLIDLLAEFDDAEVVGAASNGAEAVEMIREKKPDLSLLDLEMPEMSGLEAVRRLTKAEMPIVAFVTAHDEFAVEAFEVGAVDYLLKPIEKSRLRETLSRARERMQKTDFRRAQSERIERAAAIYEEIKKPTVLERIPVRVRDGEILLVPAADIVSVVADGELLHITTAENKRFVVNHRLKDLEARLAPERFARLSRGAIVNLDAIAKISQLPGGTYSVFLIFFEPRPIARSARAVFETMKTRSPSIFARSFALSTAY